MRADLLLVRSVTYPCTLKWAYLEATNDQSEHRWLISFAALSIICRDFTIRQSPHSQLHPRLEFEFNRNKFKHCNNTAPIHKTTDEFEAAPILYF